MHTHTLLKGCVLMGQDEWDCVRVLRGRPAVGSELTEDFNPLEAGLCRSVSVEKVRIRDGEWIETSAF